MGARLGGTRTTALLAVLALAASLAIPASGVAGSSSGGAGRGVSRPVNVEAAGPYRYASCRFGATVDYDQHAHFSIAEKLNIGVYLDFGLGFPPQGPAEAEYLPLIHVSQGGELTRTCEEEGEFSFSPELSQGLANILAAYPGRLWLVGNEPDRVWQDNVCPQQFAQAYHEAYTFIKEHDPTAQVAVGGLVLVSPMRIDYLDIFWESYFDRYGEPMPVDVWSMHAYVLSEQDEGDANLAVGADPSLAIPFSFECDEPDTICHAEHDDVGLFAEQVVRMREWMKSRGYQDKPLIVTEYGILKPFHYPYDGHPYSDGVCSVTTCPSPPEEPDCFCDETDRTFNPERVGAFATATFDELRSAIDLDLGLPADEGRLVQQWLWYRLATPGFDDLGHASNLVDPAETGPDSEWVLTQVGQDWQDYVQAIPPTVNLRATAVPETAGYLLPGGDASVMLLARGVNSGDVTITDTVAVTFYADEALTSPLGSTTFTDDVPGCARREVAVSLQTTWPGVGAGDHTYWFLLDSPDSLGETDETDNVGSGTVHVFARAVFIPLSLRTW